MPEASAAQLSQELRERLSRIRVVAAASEKTHRDIDWRMRAAVDHWARVCPYRFRDATLDTIEALTDDSVQKFPRQIFNKVVEWTDAEPYPGNLLITGNLGTGKSWLACAICHVTAERRGWFNQFVSLEEMFEEDNRSMMRTGGLGPLERYVKARVLVLDDVGAGREALTEAEERRLVLVMDKRWRLERPTIVTTNLKTQALLEYVGPRIAERLLDGCSSIRLPGESRRDLPEGAREQLRQPMERGA